ncbi:SGNH/GDSL hydrolase family protein [Anaerofustis stercorihominis]|uniref:SGNH/GDSL hydrolase family protein n=1 Tax=Anaerofustis stercorihominis TaxID=214853 RepID=A0A3E3DWU4_9FIRM|nr:SGNH/GDSL hydrolase family protein [Anaerofustis stercorihominis]RGD73703.1 SGNH/GDSL hydrolase family protein [Anaerofustis stercorihominis]
MKVICIGDSLTNGNIGYTYRDYLGKRYETINKGIDGDTTEGVAFRLKRCLKDKRYQDIDTYILFVGINDLLFSFYAFTSFDEEMYENSQTDFKELYESMLNDLKNHDKKVIVIGLPYVEYSDFNQNLIISRNNVIKSLTEKYGFSYIDIYSLQKEEAEKGTTLTLDGVHFAEISAKLLAVAITKQL